MKIICFHNTDEENGYLSNWYLSNFTVNGMKFSSVGQYMMYQKAVSFNDTVSASQIMDTNEAAVIKAPGRAVHNYDDDVWNKTREDVVHDAVFAKFSQNNDLKKQLLDTGNSILAECAVKDRIWEIGLSMKDPDRFDSSKRHGKNPLGYTIMKIREELR